VVAVGELDHGAGVHVDQVMVMAAVGRVEAGAAAAEVTPLQDALLLQQAHRAVDGGDGDAGVQRHGAAVQLLHVRMVLGLGQHAGDKPALAGHLEPALDAKALDPRRIGAVRDRDGAARGVSVRVVSG
jgi:hypothetical protein